MKKIFIIITLGIVSLFITNPTALANTITLEQMVEKFNSLNHYIYYTEYIYNVPENATIELEATLN